MYQLKNSSILVVGGTGFIGINLVKKLLSVGSQVTTLSLKRKRYKIKHKNLKYIFCDYTNFNTSNGTFTAPITGKYSLNLTVRINSIDTAATYYIINIVIVQLMNKFFSCKVDSMNLIY